MPLTPPECECPLPPGQHVIVTCPDCGSVYKSRTDWECVSTTPARGWDGPIEHLSADDLAQLRAVIEAEIKRRTA